MKKTFLVFLLLGFLACKKTNSDKIAPLPNSQEILSVVTPAPPPPISNWYLNTTKVSANSFDLSDTSLRVVVWVDTIKKVTNISAFTTEAGYVALGNAIGFDLGQLLQIEKDLSSYAQSSGAITQFETSGTIPQSYTNYENQYLGNIGMSAGALHGVWRDPCSGTPSTAYSAAHAVMYLGAWDNRVTAFESYKIWGGDAIYDKRFFQRHLVTFVGFGLSIRFCDYPYTILNNKASSWLSKGF